MFKKEFEILLNNMKFFMSIKLKPIQRVGNLHELEQLFINKSNIYVIAINNNNSYYPTFTGEIWEWETNPWTFSISDRFFSETWTNSGPSTSLVTGGEMCSGGGTSSSWYRYFCEVKKTSKYEETLKPNDDFHNYSNTKYKKYKSVLYGLFYS